MASGQKRDEDAQIGVMAQTLLRLMPKSPNGWVKWRTLAKEMYGTDEYADLLISMASMEPVRHYFTKNERAVTLTAAGHQFACSFSPEPTSITGAIADRVREYASSLRDIRLDIRGLSRVAAVGQRVVQAVTVDASDEPVASETPCEFRPRNGEKFTYGRVIGQEPDGAVLYVAFDSEVFASSLPASLSIDRAYLVKQLSDRIRDLNSMPTRMAAALRVPVTRDLSAIADKDSYIVAAKLADLKPPWTQFLWGPPGAGKTYGLGLLAVRLLELEPSSKTLIVAPSNRAVDVAMEQVLTHIGGSPMSTALTNRELLRYGYPRKPQILARPELLGSPTLDELNAKVRRLSLQIIRAEKERGDNSATAVLRTEMLALQESVKAAVEAHIGLCRIVATTVTLSYLASSPISKYEWDNVIVDEVTMVTPAMCTFLASLARQRFLLAGDPQQLGPVFETNSGVSKDVYEWMGRDVFDKSGISHGDGVDRRVSARDTRLSRISAQRRCTVNIWNQVKHLYASVQNLADESERRQFRTLPPLIDESTVLLDTTSASPQSSCRKRNSSWENEFTAALAIAVATEIATAASGELSIAIIAPYRAQVRLLRKILRLEQRDRRSPLNDKLIDAGTVHQFQGSDADVVIFDMVDGAGRTKVGQLLRGDTGMRLVNVAFTRAKGKLLLIADKSWCAGTMLLEHNKLLSEFVFSTQNVARVDVRGRPEIDAHERNLVANRAREALFDALRERNATSLPAEDFVLLRDDGTPLAKADLAYPPSRIAVNITTPRWNPDINVWNSDWRLPHAFAERGWTTMSWPVDSVMQDPGLFADDIIQALSRTRERHGDRGVGTGEPE